MLKTYSTLWITAQKPSFHCLHPFSDSHLISPYSISSLNQTLSSENKGNDPQPMMLWLSNKFSLSRPKEMYREEWGENGHWCSGVKS